MKTKLILVGAFVIATLLTFSFTFSNSPKKAVEKNTVDTVQEDYSAPAGGSVSVRI
jgi:hypothetical protein